jgi:hypothetical protein
VQTEERSPDDVGAFLAFQQFGRGLFVREAVVTALDDLALCTPVVPESPMASDPEQPVAKSALGGVKSIESLDGQQPDLLVDFFGDLMVPAGDVVDQAVDIADVALVHRAPSRTIAPGHRPEEAKIVVHLASASVGLRLLHHIYCHEPRKSLALSQEIG